jgi:hypothetical protein
MVHFEERSALRTTVDYFIERIFPLAAFDTSEICFIHHSLLISPRSGSVLSASGSGKNTCTRWIFIAAQLFLNR